jgi:glucokinase
MQLDGERASVAPIMAAIRTALASAGDGRAGLRAIAIGVPGQVRRSDGNVRSAVNLGWDGFPLGRLVSDAFGVPCAVENDVRLAAASLVGGELAGGARSLAYVAIGTGVGAGLVLSGRLYRGPRGMAGEIGHTVVDPNGHRCACGQRGCLETVVSGPSVARSAAKKLAGGTESLLHPVGRLTADQVYDAARAGDALALEVTRAAGQALARALANLILTCDVERVLLGGGVAAAGDPFLTPIDAELDRLRADSALIAQLVPPGTVQLMPPDAEAVAHGAVALANRLLRRRRAAPASAVSAAGGR